jgi:hypothetical protein
MILIDSTYWDRAVYIDAGAAAGADVEATAAGPAEYAVMPPPAPATFLENTDLADEANIIYISIYYFP